MISSRQIVKNSCLRQTPSTSAGRSVIEKVRGKIIKPVTVQPEDFFVENHKSSALDMMDKRLGLGSNAVLRLCWWEDGRIKAAKALFTRSPPSTVPIRTSEFVIADLRAFNRFGEYVVPWLVL